VFCPGCKLGPTLLVGGQTKIADDAVVRYSGVGRKCVVGPGCKIENSQIWEGVSIGAKAVVQGAILCSDVVVGEGCEVGPGCVLSAGVQLAPGTVVPPNTRVTCLDEGGAVISTDEKVVGVGGKGAKWSLEEEADEDDEDCDHLLEEHLLSVPYDDDGSSDDGLFDAANDDGSEADEEEGGGDVLSEIRDMVCDAARKSLLDNNGILVQIKGYQYSQELQLQDVASSVLQGMLRAAVHLGGDDAGECCDQFDTVLQAYSDLLTPFTGHDDEGERLQLHAVVISCVVEVAKEHPLIGEYFDSYLRGLMSYDIISEVDVQKWVVSCQKRQIKQSLDSVTYGMMQKCEYLVPPSESDSDSDDSSDDSSSS